MNGTRESSSGRSATASGNYLVAARKPLLGLLLLNVAVLIARMFVSFPLPMGDGIWRACLVILALAASLAVLCAELPTQNVLLAATIIGVVGGGIHTLGSLTGIPFGPFFYTHDAGPELFNSLWWAAPFVWIIAVITSRGVARLILRPWRKLRVYGYWLIGVTTLLILLLDVGLEPFATRVEHLWIWHPMKLNISWYEAPLTNFLGWGITALFILVVITPPLTKKKPVMSESHFDPLLIWTAMEVLFIAGSISRQLWLATAVNAVLCFFVILFAVRGAKW